MLHPLPLKMSLQYLIADRKQQEPMHLYTNLRPGYFIHRRISAVS